jgi:hypothetical protein
VHYLFINFKKTYVSITWEILYNILIEFGILMKLVSLIKMCLTETYGRVRVGRRIYVIFTIKNGLKNENVLSQLLFKLVLD